MDPSITIQPILSYYHPYYKPQTVARTKKREGRGPNGRFSEVLKEKMKQK